MSDPNAMDLSRWRSVRTAMGDLASILEEADGEVVINRPGEVLVETPGGWNTISVPSLNYRRLKSLAETIATATAQNVDEREPVLSATLATGERVQVVLPPACTADTVCFVFRKPSKADFPLESYEPSGYFIDTRLSAELSDEAISHPELLAEERELLCLLRDGRFTEFWTTAVHHHQNIVLSGATGSGKTTFMKSIANVIPTQERLVTIEDAQEVLLNNHANKVHLFYSRGGQGVSNATAKSLLEACLRLYPNRVLLAELRGEEAWYYIRNVMSGHPGSITSMHASDELGVFDQLTLLIKESGAGATISREDLKSILFGAIDITAQVKKTPGGRRCTGIYYNPFKKRGLVL
ncbi:P-type DNA transfer ATPase VirB11 [Xanthomonas phaseoli pv. dieffenbachiae]|uniref:P-type DNA transfer ATPase VirB11 n=1 Tax=Xanthomonas TaxID=338 RepID=UPI001ADB31B4|nr:P-type DNA transfer ATPase VirB11 [Xanthomonas phaseoli]MBO9898843.1 P-type DNA transfer ATPase VirB11 [Xanthomonas phaseoli pv. dieffenbachiae]CAD7740216.1 P-type DNA transfer ATPase VirB11 [Xanthomonas hydrangeae]CAD7740220.1 P-type DNA transfer ATPase VirB11 [Xanthomonas hydrangeae]